MTHLVLKPHPACLADPELAGEVVDIYEPDGSLPWCNTHMDLFWHCPEIHSLLHNKKTVEVRLEVVSVSDND